MPEVNRRITLAVRPVGMPKESDFRLEEQPLPKPLSGEVLVRAHYLSVDPYMRGRISSNAGYTRATEVGEIMPGGVVGEVVESSDPRLGPGDYVEGLLGWQEWAVAPAKSLRKIDPSAAPISTALYVLGMPGLTAYFGLLDICRPQPGETVVVSAAAGAVGSLVGQIAKIKRCRAIGIAGSNEKIHFITRELGFDAGLNYKETPDYRAKLRELCPNGINVYFDNVGGAITDEVMRQIDTRARIAICGQISEYNDNGDQPSLGPRWLRQLIIKQAKVEGFLTQQFADRFEEGYRQMGAWLREKRIKYREDLVDGLESAPRAFIRMLQGQNIGKQLVRLVR
jgi:NADPH-dependent curcumin reductase CurA